MCQFLAQHTPLKSPAFLSWKIHPFTANVFHYSQCISLQLLDWEVGVKSNFVLILSKKTFQWHSFWCFMGKKWLFICQCLIQQVTVHFVMLQLFKNVIVLKCLCICQSNIWMVRLCYLCKWSVPVDRLCKCCASGPLAQLAWVHLCSCASGQLAHLCKWSTFANAQGDQQIFQKPKWVVM